jgi:glycosyltransferase involved in cell wall biosynthesis
MTGQDAKLPSITVLIPTFQRAALLIQTLNSVQNADFPKEKMQIIVVNDGSTDDTDRLCQKIEGIHYLRHKANRGRAETRNTGLAAATGEIIFFIDDDQILPEGYFRAHLAVYRQNPRCVATVGQYKTPEPFRDAWGTYLENRGPVRFTHLKPLSAKYFQGGNVSVRKDVLERCGPFDPLFDQYGGEDADLGQRIRQHGQIYFCRQGYSYHYGIPKLEIHLKRLEEFGRDGLPKLMLKHPALQMEYRISLFKRPLSTIWISALYNLCHKVYSKLPQPAANVCFSYMLAYRVYQGFKNNEHHAL